MKKSFEDFIKIGLSFWAYLLAHFFELLYTVGLRRTVIETLLETILDRNHQFDYNGANELKNKNTWQIMENSSRNFSRDILPFQRGESLRGARTTKPR